MTTTRYIGVAVRKRVSHGGVPVEVIGTHQPGGKARLLDHAHLLARENIFHAVAEIVGKRITNHGDADRTGMCRRDVRRYERENGEKCKAR